MGKFIGRISPLLVCLGCAVFRPEPNLESTPSTGNGIILVHYPEEELPAPAEPFAEAPAAPIETKPTNDSLALAATCLERGDDAGALPHLARYVELHPDHATIRAHYAELLLRLKKTDEARRQFERYVGDAQQLGETACKHLVQVETRLLEIAEAANDAYGEHLHRGIGLYLLARQVASRPEKDGPDPQKMFFKAAEELKLAAAERRDEARPHWYAYLVWVQVGQQLPARRSLRAAHAAAPVSDLTRTEREELNLAWTNEMTTR